MLPRLEALLQASGKVKSFQIIDNDPIDEANFLFKIRCELTSGQTLQIRLRAVAGSIRYSYQKFATSPYDAGTTPPIFRISRTFPTIALPHRHHDGILADG
jgi:hypothetical protein